MQQLAGSPKTIANKHGFASAAFNAAVKKGLIESNPCMGRRLPQSRPEEMVFLTPAEFQLMHDCLNREMWRNLAMWLVSTGMRFSEATALTPADIDLSRARAASTRRGSTPGTTVPR